MFGNLEYFFIPNIEKKNFLMSRGTRIIQARACYKEDARAHERGRDSMRMGGAHW